LAERYAMAIINGLVFNIRDKAVGLTAYHEYIEAWDKELSRSGINLKRTLRTIFTEYNSLLPDDAPSFVTFVHEATGDRLGDALSRLNARRPIPISSWDVLTGAAPEA